MRTISGGRPSQSGSEHRALWVDIPRHPSRLTKDRRSGCSSTLRSICQRLCGRGEIPRVVCIRTSNQASSSALIKESSCQSPRRRYMMKRRRGELDQPVHIWPPRDKRSTRSRLESISKLPTWRSQTTMKHRPDSPTLRRCPNNLRTSKMWMPFRVCSWLRTTHQNRSSMETMVTNVPQHKKGNIQQGISMRFMTKPVIWFKVHDWSPDLIISIARPRRVHMSARMHHIDELIRSSFLTWRVRSIDNR